MICVGRCSHSGQLDHGDISNIDLLIDHAALYADLGMTEFDIFLLIIINNSAK